MDLPLLLARSKTPQLMLSPSPTFRTIEPPTGRSSMPRLPKAFTFTPKITKRKTKVLAIQESPMSLTKKTKSWRKQRMSSKKKLAQTHRPVTQSAKNLQILRADKLINKIRSPRFVKFDDMKRWSSSRFIHVISI